MKVAGVKIRQRDQVETFFGETVLNPDGGEFAVSARARVLGERSYSHTRAALGLLIGTADDRSFEEPTIKEGDMFARHVSMRLKPNSVVEFNRILEKEVIPLLQKQKGFRDEIALISPSGTEVVGISLWDQKENAEAYQREAYSEVQRLLARCLEGAPLVQTYEVSNSTFHKIAARATA